MRVRLTERGGFVLVVACLALGLGMWWRYQGLVVVAGIFTVLLALDLLTAAVPVRLTVRRVVRPLQVARFERCTGTLTLGHTRRWAPVVVDGVEPVGRELTPIAATWLRHGAPVEIDYELPTHTRGLLRVGPTRLRRLGRTGLAARTEEVGGEVAVRVVPRVLPVRGMPPGLRRGHVGGDERVAQGGTDLVGLREYQYGDDLRRVHCATTARTGTLMVREDADPSRPHLAVLLDDQTTSYRQGSGDAAAAFEEAVDVAAALVGAASADGHAVRLGTTSGWLDADVPSTGVGTGRPAPELLAMLADVTLTEVHGQREADGPTSGQPASAPPESRGPRAGAPRHADVLAVITGAGADEGEFVLRAGHATVGVVLAVDARPVAAPRVSGSVVVLRGPAAPDLLRQWDGMIADAGGPWQ